MKNKEGKISLKRHLAFGRNPAYQPKFKISNHQLTLNSQLKYYARDENGRRVQPGCTFCTLSHEVTIEKEGYKHFFLNYIHNRLTLEPIAQRYNVRVPNRLLLAMDW